MTGTSNDANSTTPLLPTTTSSPAPEPQQNHLTESPVRRIASASTNMLNTVASGAAFGAALVASGVYQPSVIVGQLKLENWHMLQAFLTATASSAVFVAALDKLGYCHQKPRQATTLNIFAKHDGNIIGGALLGAGMALAGACPGTVLAQVGVGIKSGYYALDGAILGGIFWTGILRPILKPCHPKPEAEGGEKVKLTVQEHVRCPRSVVLLAFEAVCAAAVAATLLLARSRGTAKISPVLGGVLIGLAQLWSLLSRKCLLGSSTAFEEVANYVWWLLKGAAVGARPKSLNNVIFGSGVAAGAWALGSFAPEFVEGAATNVAPALAVAGGFLMIVGSRMAGGCTSGHGISGMSMFSVSSFYTIGTALAVGVLTSSVIMPAFA